MSHYIFGGELSTTLLSEVESAKCDRDVRLKK